uniref:Secreted protein n=1 Tax=Glycine max TaxID=3847 RepID=K7N246_SOYBN
MRALLCSHSVLVHLIKLLLLLLLLCNCKDLSLLLCNCKDLCLLLLCDRDTSAPYLGVGLWKLCSLQGFGLWNSWSLLGLFGVLTLQFVRGAHSFSQGVILSEAIQIALCPLNA